MDQVTLVLPHELHGVHAKKTCRLGRSIWLLAARNLILKIHKNNYNLKFLI